MKKLLHIFKAGTHVASDGTSYTFSEADLAATARAYNPALHEAPIVVGHPKTDGPAHGWVRSLKAGTGLEAESHQVEPTFAEMVAAGRFKKISASFFPPTSPNNPVPGVYYLRHVGFLGAMPPAVKGLRDASFAADADGVIEFAEWADLQNASLWRRLRDWLISDKGLDTADKIVPDYMVASLEDAARTPESELSPAAAPAFSEGVTVTPEQLAVRDAELKLQAEAQARKEAEQKARDVEFAEREARIRADEQKRARAEVVEFVEGLVKAGKVLPAQQAGMVAFMAAQDTAFVIEFGEGDGKKSLAGSTWLREYLQAMPNLVDFTERAGNDKKSSVDTDNATDLARRAVEFQESEAKAGRAISVSAAVEHITKQAAGQ